MSNYYNLIYNKIMSLIYGKVNKFENYVDNVSVGQGIRSQSLLLCYQQIIVSLPTAVSFKVVKMY